MEAISIQHRHHCNRAERGEWVALYLSSKLRPDQFAEQHGLKLGTLRRWVRQEGHGSLSETATPGFQELLLPSVTSVGPWAAEVQLPDGVVVRLGAAATSSWIASLLKAVRPSC